MNRAFLLVGETMSVARKSALDLMGGAPQLPRYEGIGQPAPEALAPRTHKCLLVGHGFHGRSSDAARDRPHRALRRHGSLQEGLALCFRRRPFWRTSLVRGDGVLPPCACCLVIARSTQSAASCGAA